MRAPAVFSSIAAPVLLIGGWLLAESRQPAQFDPLRDTISDLAAADATSPHIMTIALAGVGLAHVVTALSLTEIRRTGRLLLGAGGVATALVALFPLPGNGGSSPAHTAAATTAFLLLAVWPLFGAGRAGETTALVRSRVTHGAGVLLALVGWFGITLWLGGPVGLAERVAAGAQAIWPLLVVQALRRP
nr:Protein of unknown function DUF998 [uncultured organism]